MQTTCVVCGAEIPAERLEALPDTTTCVAHSQTQKYVGFMVSDFAKGTAPALIKINPGNKEDMRQAVRANRRRR
jgi:hypothetical protein